MTDRLIIDCHHHMGPDPDYAAKLVDECARLGIAKVCTIAPGGGDGNSRLAGLLPQYGDTLLGYARVRWTEDTPEDIASYRDQGFTGLKFIVPPAPYDDERWFPLYEKAEELIQSVGPDEWLVLCRAPIEDVNEACGLSLPEGESVTLNGYLCDEFGEIPVPGRTIVLNGARFTVLQSTRRRIVTCRVKRLVGEATADDV